MSHQQVTSKQYIKYLSDIKKTITMTKIYAQLEKLHEINEQKHLSKAKNIKKEQL